MPDFTIRGNPGAIRSRAATTVQKGQTFFDVGQSLAKTSPDGWTGRAADHFRDAHDLEPDRWIKSGNGFIMAGNALEVFAGEVQSAQSVAEWAEGEYARGEQVSADARSAYDADVADGKQKQANYLSQGIPFDLTIVPFDDPGEEIRQNAVTKFNAAKADLETAAHTCAAEVKSGCRDAPEKPNWFESGLRFVAGVWEGAGEAVWDLLTLSPFGVVNMVQDTWKLANGDLTPEELMAKYKLSLETAEGMLNALKNDPVEFGKQLGKGLVDWDTWADDPARAWGHLVPDIIIAAATMGTGEVAAGGARGVEGAADGAEALTALSRADELAALGKVDDVDVLTHLDDADGLLQHTDDLVPDYPLADGSTHIPQFDPGSLGGADDIAGAADAHGLTPQQLDDALHTPVDQLSPDMQDVVREVRDAGVIEPSTVMEKVLPDSVADDLLDGTSRYPVDSQAGFMARAGDLADATTPQRLFDDLALDYDGSPFRAPGQDGLPPMADGVVAQDHMNVVRFEAGSPDQYVVPRHSSLGGDGTWDAGAVKPVSENPFTGNGWTHGDHPVPEVTTTDPIRLPPNSEMWRIDADGHQELVAVLKRVDGAPAWVAVR